jgi:glutathione S-transferase
MAFKFTLHGAPQSTCTRVVAVIAKERNIPFETVTLNFREAEHKQPANLAHHPFGQVPYIAVRRLSLFSLAIIVMSYARSCE